MSIRTVSCLSFTPTATADTTNLADATHLSIQGSTATERIVLQELYIGGQAPSASSPMWMVLARHTTFGAGTVTLGTNARDAATDATSATGTARGYSAVVTTKPQRSATQALLVPTFNAFGGNFKWQPSGVPGKDISLVSATQPLGEFGLSQFTGGTAALIGAHMIYEVI
jgi:hypothetical protein